MKKIICILSYAALAFGAMDIERPGDSLLDGNRAILPAYPLSTGTTSISSSDGKSVHFPSDFFESYKGYTAPASNSYSEPVLKAFRRILAAKCSLDRNTLEGEQAASFLQAAIQEVIDKLPGKTFSLRKLVTDAGPIFELWQLLDQHIPVQNNTVSYPSVQRIFLETIIQKLSDIDLQGLTVELSEKHKAFLTNLVKEYYRFNVVKACMQEQPTQEVFTRKAYFIDLPFSWGFSIQELIDYELLLPQENEQQSQVLKLAHRRINSLDGIKQFPEREYVTAIDLSGNNVAKLGQRVFDGFENLNRIVLSHNQIEGFEAEAFEGLTQLEVLNLSHNRINIIPRKAFNNAPLQELDLSFNALSTVNLKLDGLKRLWLSNNRIRAITQHTFKDVQGLEELYLSDNMINPGQGAVWPNAFKGLTKLQVLDLSNRVKDATEGNAMTHLNGDEFAQLSSLRTLNMSNVGLKAVGHALNFISTLKELHVDNNPELSLDGINYQRLPHLEMLYIDANKVTLEQLQLLVNLRSLYALNDGTKPSDVIKADIRALVASVGRSVMKAYVVEKIA